MTLPDLYADICRAIVGPDFRLVVTQGEVTLLIEVFAKGSESGGPLIGKQGQLVSALRMIARAAGPRCGLRVHVTVEVE
jgi:predicted RNA-binding protein YlqC (UPF0109 family)